jgi:hypothetical protein
MPQHEEDRSLHLVLEDAVSNATTDPLIQSASPGVRILPAHHHLIAGLIRSYPNSDHDDPTQRRNSITFSAVPKEIPRLQTFVRAILKFMTLDPFETFDAIHLCIPDRPLRSVDTYPSTQKLQELFTDPRIIIHRLSLDYGPMTRYLGPLAYEHHPESAIVLLDIDSNATDNHTQSIVHLVYASRHLDESALWCLQGENFAMNEFQQVKPNWDLFPVVSEGTYLWNHVHFCRGVRGMLFKPQHFADFWYNQSDYHESCFWDDDRWVSYQMERQGFPRKVVHVPTPKIKTLSPMDSHGTAYNNKEKSSHHRRLGSLTDVNKFLQSDQTCPVAWLTKHPDTYPTVRVTSGTPLVKKEPPLTMEEIMNLTSELLGADAQQLINGMEKAHRYQAMHERAKKLNAKRNGLQEIGI